MNRRNFFKLTGTYTGGILLLPDFLHAFALQEELKPGNSSVVFIQLNGGNDGLNTFIPYQDERYYAARPGIAIHKDEVISGTNGMGFHPNLKGFADIQQNGHLTVVQNVGYPKPNRSHFRSREIWQTASDSDKYVLDGWLGRFLDVKCKGIHSPAGINLDTMDNLALKSGQPNSLTIKDPSRFTASGEASIKLSGNPQLDFVRKVAETVNEGANVLSKALANAPADDASYPKTELGRSMQWMGKLIKGGLNSKVYYTSLDGFDTHESQIVQQGNRLKDLNNSVYAFYNDMLKAKKLQEVTIVIFSEFGRRVQSTGTGTDHGTAAPMFIIGGNNRGKVIGNNPDLANLDNGDLIHQTDFRSVYAALLKDKFSFDPKLIGIKNDPLKGLFS